MSDHLNPDHPENPRPERTPDCGAERPLLFELSVLHQLILTSFTRAFGQPDHSMGKDMHWGLRPRPEMAAVHVLVNGSSACPIVWVFDPHAPDHREDGVHHEAVTEPEVVERLLVLIRARVVRAAGADGIVGG